ncbi:hypothetical protein ACFX2C_023377 [Malus domestica]
MTITLDDVSNLIGIRREEKKNCKAISLQADEVMSNHELLLLSAASKLQKLQKLQIGATQFEILRRPRYQIHLSENKDLIDKKRTAENWAGSAALRTVVWERLKRVEKCGLENQSGRVERGRGTRQRTGGCYRT